MTAGALAAGRASWGRPLSWASTFEFLITGGLTFLFLPLSYLYRNAAGVDQSTFVVSFAAFYAAYLINDPHFAVSYLLFYKNAKRRLDGTEFQGAQRIRYVISGFVVPLVLVGWIATALSIQSAQTLGAMVQLMYLLVGWHYVKQGFGVLTVLSARRGVRFSNLERNILLTHCFAGWAYAWASPREMGNSYEEAGVMYNAFAHPPYLEQIALAAFVLSTGLLVWALARRIMRGEAMPPLAAASGFLLSIWMWTVYSQVDPLMIYIIPGLHSLQYWYFVYLLKKGETLSDARAAGVLPAREWKAANPGVEQQRSMWGYATKRLGLYMLTAIALAWLFFAGIPEFLDAHFVATTASMGLEPDTSPLGLGPTPYVAAFATFINIHHYFMDHVIWRRENPDTKFMRS